MSTTDERRAEVLGDRPTPGRTGSAARASRRARSSRAAVHRHVDALRREGIAVTGVHEGYVLDPGSDPVVPGIVEERLSPPLAGPVRWLRTTGSTNDDVAAAAREGAAEGLVIGADLQTAGRGRRGRAWVTDPDEALLFSVLLRPPVAAIDAAFLPIVVAVGGGGGDHRSHHRLAGTTSSSTARRCAASSANRRRTSRASPGPSPGSASTSGAPRLADARWSAGHSSPSGLRTSPVRPCHTDPHRPGRVVPALDR